MKQRYGTVQGMDVVFEHGASGSQWETSTGCVIWTGVRVRDVVEYLDIEIDMTKQKLLDSNWRRSIARRYR